VLAQQGTLSSPTDWVFDAAISPRWDAFGAAIVYNRSSSSIYPVLAARMRFQSTPLGNWEPGELILASSTAADTDHSCNSPPASPCRWGDYAAATPDPVQTSLVWGTGEFNTASGPTPAWSNQNFAIWVAATPSAVTAWAGDATASVSWSAPPVSVGPVTNYTIKAYVGATVVATTTTADPGTVAIFKGLINGTTYTFTVTANGTRAPRDESLASNPVTPTRVAVPAPTSAPPSRDPVTSSGPAPSPSGR
jgi:titin